MRSEWSLRAKESIHHGSLTNSKRSTVFTENYPTHVIRGRGCILYDDQNKEYIDYICGLGTNLLGYAEPKITEAVFTQLLKGTVFSLGSTLEVEAAEKIKEILHFVGKVRFLKTGTEACMGAVRIALSHTGRKKVLSHGYHGWADQFISLSKPALGVNETPYIETFTSLDQITEEVGCIILEPVITDYSSERVFFLDELIKKCKKHGVLVIFDEIITGFRWPNWTFSNDVGLYPDIILLGKAVGGGLPLSVIATKPGIGENQEWFVSSTFGGDNLALAAMMKTIDLLTNSKKITEIWDDGLLFYKEFNEIYPEKIKLEGYPTRGVFTGDPLVKALLFQEACNAGILLGPSFFYNYRHKEVRETVINSLKDILIRIKNKQVKLIGDMPSSPFAQKQRE